MIFEIDPVPKPRMTQRDSWCPSKAAQRYFSYANQLRLLAQSKNYQVEIPLQITFILPMPRSWSKKKREKMEGKPHTQRPDLDNLLKAFKDSLLKEDSHIWKYGNVEKIWGKEGKIIVQ